MTPPDATLLEAPPATEPIAPDEATAPVEGPVTPRSTGASPAPTSTPAPRPAAASTPDTRPERSGRRGRRVWGSLKVLFALAVLAAIVVAAVVGWPTIRDRVYGKVDANAADIQSLNARLAESDARIADLQTQLDTLGERQAAVPSRLDDLEATAGDLAAGQAATDASLTGIDARIGAVESNVTGVDGRVTELDAASVARSDEMNNRLEVSRATELLSRARLFLYQANYGLALSDLTVARSILDGIDPALGGITPDVRDASVARVALAIASLPDRPVLAADDLDIAWHLLVDDGADPLLASSPPVPIIAGTDSPVPDATGTGSAVATGAEPAPPAPAGG